MKLCMNVMEKHKTQYTKDGSNTGIGDPHSVEWHEWGERDPRPNTLGRDGTHAPSPGYKTHTV